MEPKIAVIVPVYNAEGFLRKSLDSILNQEFNAVKVICVNDASPDHSKEILEEYSRKDNRIVVLNHEVNKGAGSARNTGLEFIYKHLPSIEYISFVDADDKIEPNTYTKTYEEAKKSDADIVNFNFLPSTYWEYKTEANTEPVDYNGNCVETLFDYKEFYTFVLCWSKLYKRELLENLRFSDQKFFEDGSFAYKVLPRAKKMRIIPDVLYYYNIENPESTCGKIDENKRLRSIFYTMKSTIDDWKKLGIYEKYKYEYIKHILLYTSMVCPNAFVGDFTKELNECLDINILSKDVSDNVPDETKEHIRKMTKPNNWWWITMVEISKEYKNRIIKMFGTIGEEWLQKVPSIIDKYVSEYRLTDLKIVSNLTYNILLFANSQKYGPIVLKIELPFKEMTQRETEALNLLNGNGACKCFYSDLNDGVVIMERLLPGVSLNTINDIDEQTRIFSNVASKVNIKVGNNTELPNYRAILDRSINMFKGKYNYQIDDLLESADTLYREIEEENDCNYLIHSDLYCDNILLSGNEWKVIDPHGFIGVKVIDTAIYIQKYLEAEGFDEKNIDIILLLIEKYQNQPSNKIIKSLCVNHILNMCWEIEVNVSEERINTLINNSYMLINYYKNHYVKTKELKNIG